MRITVTVCLIVLLATSLNAQWVQTNGPEGGVVTFFAVNGTNLFAGTWGGGVFLSTNDGTNWTAVSSGLTNKIVNTLATNGTNLFAGTYGGGVFLSTNNGTNWNAVNSGLTDTNLYFLAVSGTNLYAGTNNGGAFRSTNNGTSWTAINSGLTNSTVTCFAINGSNLFAGAQGGGVFLSTNNGTNWTAVSSGLTNTTVWFLAFNGSDLFAATDGGGVFRSTNNGASWTAVNEGLTDRYVYPLVVSGGDIFAGTYGGGGVFRSTNNGASWTAVNSGLTNNSVWSFTVNGSNLFAGTAGGVFRSSNNGTSWTAVNAGMRSTRVMSLAISPDGVGGTNLYAGNDNGVFLSTNNGSNWNAINSGISNAFVNSILVNGINLFAGTYNGVFRSTNNGTSWTAVNSGLTNTTVRSLAITPNELGGMNLFAGTNGAGVFLSTSYGTRWTAVNSGMTHAQVYSLVISPDGAGGTYLIAGTYGNGVFRSTDNGTSWTAVNSGLSNTNVHCLVLNGPNLFAGTSGGGVFRSTDNGGNWIAVNAGLTNTNIYSLGVSGTYLFAGTWGGGVFLSTNNGASWTQVNTGLINTYITALAPTGTNVFAGSYAQSVFRRPLSELTSSSLLVWSPNGGDQWKVGTLKNIAWTSTLVTNVKIEYSTNNGVVWSTIAASIPASEGCFPWVVRNTPTVQALVKISDASNALMYDISDATFTIVPPDDTTLVAYYPFNSNANDESGNGNNGTNNGATLTTDRFGNANKAYSFNGSSQYISTSFTPNNIFSISLWYKKSSHQNQTAGVFSTFDGGFSLFDGIYYGLSGSSEWVITDGNVGASINSSDTNWRHLAITSDGVYLKLVENDSLMLNYHATTTHLAPVVFGDSRYDGRYFTGCLDDIRIYNRALSQAEITSLYFEGGYGFGSVSGIVFNDVNGNGVRNDGESVLSGWKVFLKNSMGTAIDSQLTDPYGLYRFDSLGGGTYIIAQAQDTAWIQTCPSGLGTYTIAVFPPNSYSGKDFGNTIGYRYTGPSGNWSDSSSWTGGHPPQPTNPAIIPSGVTVTVDALPSDSILALKVAQGGALEFTPQVGQLKVAQSVQIDPGASLNFLVSPSSTAHQTLTLGTTGIICYKDWVNHGTVLPGQSIITFAGTKAKVIATDQSYTPFYKLEISGDNTTTQGNVLVLNQLALHKSIEPRDEDSVFIENVDPAAIADTGKIIRGTVRRQIRPGETGPYRFESASSFVRFDGTGAYPASVSMTLLPDVVPANGHLQWEVVGGAVDSVHNTVSVDTVRKFSKWPFGIPPSTLLTKQSTTEATTTTFFTTTIGVRRAYQIQTNGGAGFRAQLQARYEQAEVLPGIDESKLRLLRGPWYIDSVNAKWNMISLPLIPEDARKTVLFPSASSRAYFYSDTYHPADTLQFGVGYWMKFPSPQLSTIMGDDRTSNVLEVKEGWNLIGAISYPIPTAGVVAVPPGIIGSEFYGYKQRYITADTLLPLHAYWIKAKAPGHLQLSVEHGGGMLRANDQSTATRLSRFNRLTLSDGMTGDDQTLYFGRHDEEIDIDRYELPPLPPVGIFDVRFATQRQAEIASTTEERAIPIAISSAQYPVTIRWEIVDRSIQGRLQVGEQTVPLNANGQIQIPDQAVQAQLLLSPASTSTTTPQRFVLEQNYPNPFNPITDVRYAICDVSYVSLKVYDLLGREVKVLVDEMKQPGEYSVQWNASGLASGVYFYRIDVKSVNVPTKSFTQVKKMLLTK